jgi:hypothetical protein
MKVTSAVKGGVLTVKASGAVRLEEAMGVVTKAFRDAIAGKARGILMDMTGLTGVLSAQQRFQLGARTAEMVGGFEKPPRVAIVGKPPVIDGFAALVAHNRGVTVELFPDEESALGWLAR